MDGGVWQATVHGITESEMTEKGHAEALQGKPCQDMRSIWSLPTSIIYN